MDSVWKSHLQTNQAVYLNNTILHYHNEQQQLNILDNSEYHIKSALSHYGVIKITGPEALSFLQSQLSNDVNGVSENQAQLNSYCSPKGRVLALFILFKIEQHYYMQIPLSLLESILKRLNLFKMRAEVEITDVSSELQCIGLSSINTDKLLSNETQNLPIHDYQCQLIEHGTIIKLPQTKPNSTPPRYLLFADSQTLIKIWDSNAINCEAVGQGPWSLLDIQAGIPNIEPQTVDSFVPQMINLQLLNAINFTKGCYPGQEIVARTKYLGKLKRRMFLLTSNSDQILDAGTELSTQNAKDDQSKGKVVNCQLTSKNSIAILAVLQLNSLNDGLFIVKSNPDITLTIQTLPYAFEESE